MTSSEMPSFKQALGPRSLIWETGAFLVEKIRNGLYRLVVWR